MNGPDHGPDHGDMLRLARLHLAAGISVIPIATDGTKQPADWNVLPEYHDADAGKYRRGWKPLQSRLATPEEAQRWWGGAQPYGIAAACGDASAGLELIDFDNEAEAVFPQYRDTVEHLSPGLLARLPVVRTPSGGYHVWLRCRGLPVPGNQKLASDPTKARATERTLIETRGTGGYALVPGCPRACHPTLGTYDLIGGPPVYEVPDVSADERDVLIAAARSFNVVVAADEPARPKAAQPGPQAEDDVRPGDDFDRRADWGDVLRPHGWAAAYTRGDVTVWRRPGKDRGISATTGHCGRDGVPLLYVFTSSTEFSPDRAYGPFRAYAVLNHAGDLSAAAKALSARGYGSPPKRQAAGQQPGGPGPADQPAQQPPPPPPPPVPQRPHDLDAERAVLAGMVRDSRVIDDVAPVLRRDDLHHGPHRDIWDAVLSASSGGRPVDPVILADELKRLGTADAPGVKDALRAVLDAAPAAANAAHHADIVRDKSILRGLLDAGERIAGLARQPGAPAAERLHQAEQLIFRLAERGTAREAVRLSDALEKVCELIAARGAPEAAPVPSGISRLDELTMGWRRGELTILAARPSVGKTSFALALARAAAGAGHATLFASLEQSWEELTERLLCAEGRLDGRTLRRPPADERGRSGILEEVRVASLALDGLPLWIDDNFTQSVFHVASCCRRLKRRHGLGLVVVDYVQLIDPESRQAKRHEQVGEISRRLKALARELDVPVIALAQLNREVEQRGGSGKPRLSDLRESGSLEQDADVVVLLHRPADAVGSVVDLDLLVAKQRNGPTGECCVRFVRNQLRFEAGAATPLRRPPAEEGFTD
jgi:replicative DNA helicase